MAVATSDRPKGRSLKPLRALPPLLKPHLHVLAAALAALLIAAGAQLALPIALRFLIDEGLAVQDTATIDRYFFAFIAAAAAFGAFAALRYYLIAWLGERVVADLRSAVYARVIRMDPTFFEITMLIFSSKPPIELWSSACHSCSMARKPEANDTPKSASPAYESSSQKYCSFFSAVAAMVLTAVSTSAKVISFISFFS